MVLAHHLVFTAYGFWLPNDPRGSWSEFVRAWELFLHGKATKTEDRRSVANRTHDRQKRFAAKKSLKYDPVRFSGRQALTIAHGFAEAIRESGYEVLACSILPTHVHMVVLCHDRLAERIIGHLKTRATQALVEGGLHPFYKLKIADDRFPSVWAHRGWKVFLFSERDIARAVEYVERNPEKDGLPRQRWSFVNSEPGAAPRKRGR